MITYKNLPVCSGIYKFTNKIDNKVYIGETINLRERIQCHLRDFKKDKINKYLYKAIRFHGIENFELEILFQGNSSKDELDQMEIDFIRLYNSNNSNFGYNMTKGGDGVVGHKQSEEHKRKVKESNKGFKHTEETKEKLRNRIVTEETREKLRKSQTGKKMKPEAIEKTRQFNLGRKLKPESIKKREETKKLNKIPNKKRNEETKKRMSEAAKGRKKSKESIEKREKTKKLNKARKLIEESCCYEEYFYNDFIYKS